MKGKDVGFTVEVLQDQGTGSIGTVTKCCITTPRMKGLLITDALNKGDSMTLPHRLGLMATMKT